MRFLTLLLSAFISVSAVHGHATMLPNQAPAGVVSQIGFQIPHACNATVSTHTVEIQVPAAITNVVPVLKAGWTYEMLNTSRPDNKWGITYVYKALPGNEIENHAYDKFDLRLTMPNTPGVRLFIPIIQYCDFGTIAAWNETGGAKPAPGITLLNPTDVQFIPTQANVRATNDAVSKLNTTIMDLSTGSILSTNTLRSNVTSLFNTYDTLRAEIQILKSQIGSPATTQTPTNIPTQQTTSTPTQSQSTNNGPVFYNSFGSTTGSSSGSSSDWSRAETLAVISIILAGLSTLLCILFYTRYTNLEKKYAYLAGLQQRNHSEFTPKFKTPTATSDVNVHLPSSTSVQHDGNGVQFHS